MQNPHALKVLRIAEELVDEKTKDLFIVCEDGYVYLFREVRITTMCLQTPGLCLILTGVPAGRHKKKEHAYMKIFGYIRRVKRILLDQCHHELLEHFL